ncbi:MAG TPA: TonB-dependent receptor, partial [Opitutaceae bacterium]|nr:TonB-dependent receptor [Opitutaceae bacterium]
DFKVGDSVSARLWLMADHATRDDKGPSAGSPVAGLQGARNPLTGAWMPFESFSSAAPYTATALTPSTSEVYTRSGQANLLKFDELHFKNDYASEHTLGGGITSTTIAGLSANYQRLIWKNWTATATPVDFANLAATEDYNPASTVYGLNKDKAGEQTDLQVFGYQRFGFLDNRLILAGGASEFWGQLARTDDSNLPVTTAPNARTISNSVTDANLGAIYKVMKGVSLFLGYNRVGGALPTSILAGEVPKNFLIQVGDQVEGGVKTSLLDGRLNLSASYFDIKQNNFQVANSAFITDPTQPQFLFYDLKSTGEEIEVNTLLTRELALVGNYTHLHMRDAYGIPQRSVPDNAGALFAKYTFADGDLKGLGFSLGLDYKDKMPGDQTSGVTAASTPGHLIVNQPSFWVASRTILSAGVSYKHANWEAAVLVDNVTNKDYIEATLSRTTIYPGLPRSWSARFTYNF